MRYAFIRSHAEQWPIRIQCRVLRVTPSGYYAWVKFPKSRRAEEDDRLSLVVQKIFEDHGGRYGAPRIMHEMRCMGYRINIKRVERLMRELGLQGRQRRRFKPVTTVVDVDGPVAPDLLQQDFSAETPNQRWVGDITYLTTSDGFEYLATVMDLFSRRIVGWAIGSSMEASLVIDAMAMALRDRRPSRGLIFHSDRGCQYTSQAFRDCLSQSGIRQSMSRTGCCYDNAAAESFFHSLKVESIHGCAPADRETVRSEVFRYIEGYYNRIRRHSSIGYMSPESFENSKVLAS